MIEVKNTLNGKLNATIIKEYPELENITITPTLQRTTCQTLSNYQAFYDAGWRAT